MGHRNRPGIRARLGADRRSSRGDGAQRHDPILGGACCRLRHRGASRCRTRHHHSCPGNQRVAYHDQPCPLLDLQSLPCAAASSTPRSCPDQPPHTHRGIKHTSNGAKFDKEMKTAENQRPLKGVACLPATAQGKCRRSRLSHPGCVHLPATPGPGRHSPVRPSINARATSTRRTRRSCWLPGGGRTANPPLRGPAAQTAVRAEEFGGMGGEGGEQPGGGPTGSRCRPPPDVTRLAAQAAPTAKGVHE